MTVRVPDRVPASPGGPDNMRQGGTVTATGPLSAVGVWVYFVVSGGPTTVTARLYDGSHTLVTSGVTSTAGWAAGWNLVPVDTPHNWDGTGTLSFVAYLNGTYKYDNSGFLPKNDSLVTVTGGIYDFGDGGYPGSTWSGLHGVAFAYTVGPATVALTPALLALTATALTPAPQPVTVALTPAVLALSAPPLAPTPGLVTVPLTPAVLRLAAVAMGMSGRITYRPDTGTTTRPNTGITPRP